MRLSPLGRVSTVKLVLLLLLACGGRESSEQEGGETASGPGGAVAVPTGEPTSAQPASLVARRCMVCHACYDAPCQLNLSSDEGLHRGASKQRVYYASRLEAAQPTRLGVDAQSVAGWRKLGFFAVDESGGRGRSLVRAMLELGRSHDFPPGEPLPDDVPLGTDRQLICPGPEEMDRYAKERPWGGMPYGMVSLPDAEFEELAAWASSPDAENDPPRVPESVAQGVARWEALLNEQGLEERIVARYLYEHWVFAHLYFDEHPEGPYFEVVRSRTPLGEPIDVIATRFPFDDPGGERFWYRLRRVDATIAHKTHITYRLGPDRLQRIRELFLAGDWKASDYPTWDPELAANPFATFEDIPAGARYQFLLDDALYFVRTFIRGPVCRGQAATDVIRDRFWVAFLDPDWDASVVDPSLLREGKDALRIPATAGENLSPLETWVEYDQGQKHWRDLRWEAYRRNFPDRGSHLDAIWDGDGSDPDALLTVFRNHDNATVVRGWVGVVPKTLWVMDFPIFERIYYDLVSGFDVFGNVGHQLAVRMYMDNLRMESEDTFLAFLPAAERTPLRESWYEGATLQLKYWLVNHLRSKGVETEIQYHTEDPKRELVEMILARSSAVAGPPDWIQRCPSSPCDRPGATDLEKEAERAFRRLGRARGRFAQHVPEISVVRVRSGEGDDPPAFYTLVHDRAHSNVAAIFREDTRLLPDQDRVTIVRGVLGSYPNFVFDVQTGEVEGFVDALLGSSDSASIERLASRFGIRRSSPRFWSMVDSLHQALRRQSPLEFGVLDLDRYDNL